MDVLQCKTEPGVLKELTVCSIVYNLVHMVMCQAATLQDIRVERIRFLGARRWLGAPTTGIPLVRSTSESWTAHRNLSPTY
jgi:hypothetical protein